MSIAKRLLLLLITSIGALLVFAVLNLVQMGRIYTAANFGNENVTPSILLLDKALMEFSHVRVRTYRHVLNTDSKVMADLETKINEAQELMKKALKDYEPLIFDADDKRLLDTDKTSFDAYMEKVRSVLELSRENQNEDALKRLTEAASLAEHVNEALGAHMKYNEAQGLRMAEEALAIKRSAIWSSAIITIVALLLVGGLTLQIRSSVTRRLDEANHLAERIAAGDLSSSGGRFSSSGDEVGQLMQ